jgi:DNA polymerase
VLILWLDFETFCETPIKHGTHRYAEKAEIMVAAWAIDDGAVWVGDLTSEGFTLSDLRERIRWADKIVIHNSHFDRTVAHHCGIDIPVEKIVDTMILAYAHSLPGSLGKLCEVLKVPTDQAKDKDGKRLINLFCQPRPKNMKLRRATRETHPEDWQKFLDYARLDIEAMRAVYKRIPKWNWTAAERELWMLDQKINDRGVQIDMDLVRAAIRAVDRAQTGLAEKAKDITGYVIGAATQRDALLAYLAELFGIEMGDLRGATVEKLLSDDRLPPDVRDLLAVRLQASTTSTAKYKTLLNAASSDGRLRGTLQFAGASRTGRWAGRLFQPQNLPRPTMKNAVIRAGIEALKAGVEDVMFENVMDLTSNAIRGCIVAPPGKKLVVADLSNIEGRVLAWLAGEDWKVQAFRDYDAGTGPDLYVAAYARTFRIPVDQVTKAQRQVGKVLELAMGYEGGVGAFITFAAAYGIDLDDLADRARPALGAGLIEEARKMLEWMKEQKRPTHGLSDETWTVIDAIKRAWRYAHPAISRSWKDVQQGVIDAVAAPGVKFDGGRLSFRKDGAWLKILLPSGRALSYPAVRVEDGKITYTGVNQFTRQWGRIGTYGGKLVENVTQAVARDVLAEGMIAAEDGGYEIVLSVHDELITETPDTADYHHSGLANWMSAGPSWADGLPLAAAGFETYRYRKED